MAQPHDEPESSRDIFHSALSTGRKTPNRTYQAPAVPGRFYRSTSPPSSEIPTGMPARLYTALSEPPKRSPHQLRRVGSASGEGARREFVVDNEHEDDDADWYTVFSDT